MNMKNASLSGFVFLLLGTVPLSAQKPAPSILPTPGCTSTHAQLEATKKAAVDELRNSGEAKFAFVDPGYIQHNPAMIKRAQDDHLSDYQEFRKTFALPPGARAAGAASGQAATPEPPPGDTKEIVMGECDMVTIIRNTYRQDPTAEPGKFYEAFTFDTYRIKNGKVVEHWDGNMIPAPVPAGRGEQPR